MLTTLPKGGGQSETDCTPVPIRDHSAPVPALKPAAGKPGTALLPDSAEPSQKSKPSSDPRDVLDSDVVGQRIRLYWDGEREW